jgi:hypothetical protein
VWLRRCAPELTVLSTPAGDRIAKKVVLEAAASYLQRRVDARPNATDDANDS